MSYMFELFYKSPSNSKKEASLTEQVGRLGGQLSYREESNGSGTAAICLTFEFEDLSAAQSAAESLRRLGEHVEGPVDYGNDVAPESS